MTGNLLIISAILGYRKMKSPTNVFLASLAFADLLLCILCLPVKVSTGQPSVKGGGREVERVKFLVLRSGDVL